MTLNNHDVYFLHHSLESVEEKVFITESAESLLGAHSLCWFCHVVDHLGHTVRKPVLRVPTKCYSNQSPQLQRLSR